MVIDYDDLARSRPENVIRLAISLGIQTAGKTHHQICREIIRWYKDHPQPKMKNR